MAIVNSSFTGMGQSSVVATTKAAIKMNFGTGSVDLEVQMHDGNWIKLETAITADYYKVFDSPVLQNLRLNCTAYTDTIVYSIESN